MHQSCKRHFDPDAERHDFDMGRRFRRRIGITSAFARRQKRRLARASRHAARHTIQSVIH